MIDWTSSYASSWRVFEVNTRTWADADLVPGVTSVTVERGEDVSERTLEAGEMSVDAAPGEEWPERWCRVVMVAEQAGAEERVEVATMLCATTSGTVNRGNDELDVTMRSVLWPAHTAELEAGSYAPAGSNGAELAGSMLSAACVAPVVVEGSFTLDDHVVFDPGSKVLEAVWLVLDAGGFTIQVHGDGTIHVLPKPTEPALELDRARARLLHPEVSHELDLSEVPNRYRAIDGAETAIAVNDDPASEVSTVRRGYFVDVRDESPKRVNGETLTAYAERMLEESSVVHDERTYSREFWPGVHPGSVVRGTLASVRLDGDLRVRSQRLTCDKGIVVEETSQREVRAWQRG